MPLRIAFDLDGVLADMEGELARQAEFLFGEVIARKPRERPSVPADPAGPGDNGSEALPQAKAAAGNAAESPPPLTRLALTSRQQRRLWRHVEAIENFWETLSEVEPGIVARLAGAAAERRWEVIFLTRRPQSIGATAQVQSQRWLASKGFTLPSVYVVQGSRGRIAAALNLDIVVDDRPENCLDVVVDSKARAILVWRDADELPAAARRLGIGTVKSIGECLDILSQIDAGAPDQPGVMSRVRRLLGLNEPARA